MHNEPRNSTNLDWRLIAIAFILLLIVTYPYSPILYELFFINKNFSYIIYIIISFFLILSYKKNNLFSKSNFNKLEIGFYGCFIFVLSLSYFITGNRTAIRDIFTLLLVIFLVMVMSREYYIKVIKYYILIVTLILLLSWIVMILYWIGIIDRLDWQINNILLSENNPFYARDSRLDFEWSLLLNFVVLAFNPEVSFQRMTLIFFEPSGLADVTFPLTFIALLDKKIPYRRLKIAILLTSFLTAYAGWGLLVMFSSLILGLICIVFFKSKYKIFIFICSLFFIIISGYVSELIKYILILLPNDKLTEFENKSEIGFINYSYLFGNYFGLTDIDQLNQISAYGLEITIYRYGIFGFITIGILFFSLIFLSASCLANLKNNFFVRLYSFVAIFGATLLSLKTPSIILVMPILVYHYIIYHEIEYDKYK